LEKPRAGTYAWSFCVAKTPKQFRFAELHADTGFFIYQCKEYGMKRVSFIMSFIMLFLAMCAALNAQMSEAMLKRAISAKPTKASLRLVNLPAPTQRPVLTFHISLKPWIAEAATSISARLKYGKRHGYGVYVWKDGDIWIGAWKDGVRAGKGISIAPNGGLHTGSWDNNTYVAAVKESPSERVITVTITETTTTTTTTNTSGGSGSSVASGSSGQSPGYSQIQNSDGSSTFRMVGMESTTNPTTGYSTLTMPCSICS
jgi:hypothetical protein